MPGRRSAMRSRATLAPCIAAAAAALLLVSACSGSGQQYVKSSADRTYFKVPSDWKLFDGEDLLAEDRDITEEQREAILSTSWRTAFDAHPDPDIRHLFASNSRFPTGMALVDELTPSDADKLSDEVLRNQFIPVDTAGESDQLELVAYENVNVGDGIHGLRFRARVVAAAESEFYPEGPPFTVEQISLVNQARDKTYSLIVMCSARCFEKHADSIEGVFDSWTVEEK